MGSNGACAQPTGFYPNGLLPNEAASATRVLDPQIWSIAEERTAELIDCIQPNKPSEERRNAIACYVQRLIAKCFSCQVFTFGSVPLKTYLPDGDIDLTAFSKNQNLKDTWADEVRDMLEHEEKSEHAEFRVKEVQYIQAEVKLIKCLVENIVVDISFNQLGGLCTLCFLEEVDSLISQNHLFKRSIILIKAWCYYESRILGAHHGLISTYALETLVLYIFHVFNNSFAGPLEVLYRFMEFFSKFDWENFCVSLWGPVPMRSLPDMTADPPRKDEGELLLNKVFLHACSSVYSVLPGGQENNELPFISKHFNVIDPLRTNNNLGRSVSKGNFFRIRSAFAFGAQRLARLLDCPKENIVAEVNQFFFNTLDRHGKGQRPDAPTPDPYGLQPLNLNHVEEADNLTNLSKKIVKENSNGNINAHADKARSNRSNYLKNEPRVRYQLARTNSSPELTDTSNEISSQGRSSRESETIKPQTTVDPNRALDSYRDEYRLTITREDQTSFEAVQMHQEEQDLVNMMASSRVHHSFGGHVQMPVNLMSPSILTSLGYGQRNSTGLMPANISSFGPHWGSNMHHSHGLQLSQYISSVGMASNHREEVVEPIEDSKKMYQEDSDHAPGSEQDAENDLTRINGSRKENRKWIKETNGVNLQHQNKKGSDIYSANSRFVSASNATASRSKQSSEVSSDGSFLKSSKSTRERRGRKSTPSAECSTAEYEPRYESESVDCGSPRADDDNGDWIPLSTAESEVAAESIVPSSLVWTHQIHNYEQLQMNGSLPMLPSAPVPLASTQRTIDNNGVFPFTFYPTGPPVPFVTMLPFYNFPNDMKHSDASTSHFDKDKEFNSTHVSQYDKRLDMTENLDLPQSSEECKSDILNSDFTSHLQNLMYGRICQNPPDEGPMLYPSPVAAVPSYHFPRDGPARPLSTNANLFNQLMGYGAGVTPLLSPHQHGTSRPAGAHQQYGDEIPRYRAGTGTYLPNPRISRDRQSSNSRNHRGNYSHDRKDHHADREGNWNVSKQRFAARNQNRNQLEKLNPRIDRTAPNNRRSDRTWDLDISHSNYPQNGQFSPSNSVHHGSSNLAYGMYPLPAMNPNGVSPPGSFVMLYPYDQSTGFSSPAEHPLEFGSVGPMQYVENSSSRVANEQQNLLLNSTRSSPDPPASPGHPSCPSSYFHTLIGLDPPPI
ncbi:hypothetical protein LguiB_015275 [Lonicera macranthoides]